MHHTLAITVLGFLIASPATAQFYKCKDAAGVSSFSQTPCSGASTGSKIADTAPAPPAGAPPAKDWAAENAAANARAGAGQSAAAQGGQWPLPAGLRKTTQAPASDKQIVAECEANRGARCNSAGEIAQRRMEQRELTADEKRQQQGAIAARRERALEESFNRR